MLEDVRVIDLAGEIAGSYCTKLLADAGAEVVKVEPPGGDPLRRWSASGVEAVADGREDGALFRFLNTSKRSVVGELWDEPVRALIDGADIVVEAFAPGVIEELDLLGSRPDLVVVSISPFGRGGPWERRPATEFTLQAACGSTGSRGTADRPPVYAGGRLGEWIAGSYAAVAALAARRRARRTGQGEHVDVSMLECMSVSLNTYAALFATFAGWKPDAAAAAASSPHPARTVEIPSIEPTRDGYVGFTTITAQQFADFLVLIERPDLLDDRDLARAVGRSRRMAEMLEIIRAWTTKRTTAEIVEQASLLRIPVALIGNGATVTGFDHFSERATFVDHPVGLGDRPFVQPRVPYRLGEMAPRPFAPAPPLGEARRAGVTIDWAPRPSAPCLVEPATEPNAGVLPLDGIRVVDFTAFWAGPAATQMLAALGADVIKIESIQRVDGLRFATTVPPSTDRWWEWGPVFHGANANKRGITLDMSRPEGLDLATRLIAEADAVVENFTPRVMENFGLDWAAVATANPHAVMVRMPAFGLSGPWRDRTGFAQTMEQISGMAWVTGFADGPPLIPRGACDPLAGMHAVFALLLALERRDADPQRLGCLIEVAMVEAALNAAAEQVVEHSAHGVLVQRDGNRGPFAAPQGVYLCARPERWVAVAVATDEQWTALREVMGRPAWAADAALDRAEGRHAQHDLLDAELARWCATQPDLERLVAQLCDAGVPAAAVVAPHEILLNPQMRARGFFEEVHHPVTGVHEYPSIPFHFESEPGGRPRWLRTPPPTVGQHNDEVLGGLLHLAPAELERLRADAVIGERPVGL